MSYSNFNVPTKRGTESRAPYIAPNNIYFSFDVDRNRLIEYYNTNSEKVSSEDLILLKNEFLFEYKDKSCAGVVTTLNPWVKSSKNKIEFDESKIVVRGINQDEFRFSENSKRKELGIDNPYYLKQTTRGILRGTVSMINTSHPGLTKLTKNLRLNEIRDYGEDLQPGDIVELYIPNLKDSNENYAQTLPYNMSKNFKRVIRYRIANRVNMMHYNFYEDEMFTMKMKKRYFNEIKNGWFTMLVLDGGKFGESVTFSILLNK
jgi:hypothetical protein